MKITKENFIKYLKCKDDRALDYIIDNYGALINSIVKKNLIYNLEHMREECVNDVLLAVWYGIENFDPKKNSFKNWIAGITKFKVIDYQRKHYKTVIQEEINEVQIIGEETLEEEFFKDVLDENMCKLLGNLKPDERKIFTDYYVKERDIEDIAQRFNLKPTAIYNRLSRARNKLRIICGGKQV